MIGKYNLFIRLKQLSTHGIKITVAITCLILILVGIAYLSNQINCTNCPLRSKYEGQVIDKSLTFAETQFGSRIKRRLLIKSKDGEVFEVAVTESVYNQSQIGDWVKAYEERIEFSK